MLWVLKRIVSFEHPKHMLKLMDKTNNSMLRKLAILDLCWHFYNLATLLLLDVAGLQKECVIKNLLFN